MLLMNLKYFIPRQIGVLIQKAESAYYSYGDNVPQGIGKYAKPLGSPALLLNQGHQGLFRLVGLSKHRCRRLVQYLILG